MKKKKVIPLLMVCSTFFLLVGCSNEKSVTTDVFYNTYDTLISQRSEPLRSKVTVDYVYEKDGKKISNKYNNLLLRYTTGGTIECSFNTGDTENVIYAAFQKIGAAKVYIENIANACRAEEGNFCYLLVDSGVGIYASYRKDDIYKEMKIISDNLGFVKSMYAKEEIGAQKTFVSYTLTNYI